MSSVQARLKLAGDLGRAGRGLLTSSFICTHRHGDSSYSHSQTCDCNLLWLTVNIMSPRQKQGSGHASRELLWTLCTRPFGGRHEQRMECMLCLASIQSGQTGGHELIYTSEGIHKWMNQQTPKRMNEWSGKGSFRLKSHRRAQCVDCRTTAVLLSLPQLQLTAYCMMQHATGAL